MRLSSKQINKIINYVVFMAVFFMQAYVDGRYIAYGQEPTVLKVLKYALVALGIIWGMLQLYGKKRPVFLKELCNILLAVSLFLIVSLVLIMFRGGDLGFCLELIIRYSMSILYAFVLLNVLEFDDIYRLMVYFLFVSIMGWLIQMGDRLSNFSLYATISFKDSYSPFESHYFAPSAMNCCAFFLYYRKNKWTQIVSFLFALMTFKRVQIVFAICLFVLPMVCDMNKHISKKTHILFCVGVIMVTLGYYALLMPEFEWIIEGLTGQPANQFTMGRSALLRELLESDYKMGGLGTSQAVLGRGIEMDLISIMLEMSLPVMIVAVFAYASVAGRKRYAMVFMLYLMVLMMTGSGLYNVFMWTTAYMFFGSVNYLRQENYTSKKRRIKIKIKM